MKKEKRIEKFLRKIDVTADAERKSLALEEILKARYENERPISTGTQSILRRLIMNKQIWKIAASLVVAVTVIGIIGIFQNGNQAAYAFEQTLAAMQGKHSFHIQTYSLLSTKKHDEFWAEFDNNGKVLRLKQFDQWQRDDNPVVVIWENGIKYQYEYDDEEEMGILLISNKAHHVDEDDLEDFDPEMIMERIYNQIEKGQAAIEISDSTNAEGNIIVTVTEKISNRQKILIVDPQTNLVLRMDTYEPYVSDEDEDNDEESYVEGIQRYVHGIEVLEYNQPFDSDVFKANFPDDTIIIDQTLREVGMAQGDLSDTDIARELVRQALQAWAADDYNTAGLLFGGAPKEYFMQRIEDKPKGNIVIEEPQWLPLEPNRPRYKVVCHDILGEDEQQHIFIVTTVAGQPGRWFIIPIKL